ncbi:hypothetical protein OUZ56_001364 [Daphnia magna]|uniref:Uncharacterized protein n=1 Tax=Daphnia magna TaxID=35525 RepID=A0ABR0A2E7_9CRUS|nr:hypothetical protein OUZ56_001364 [Daphnia magna]
MPTNFSFYIDAVSHKDSPSCIREFQDVNYGDDDGRDRDDSELLKTRQKRRGGKRKDMKESEKNGNRQLYT